MTKRRETKAYEAIIAAQTASQPTFQIPANEKRSGLYLLNTGGNAARIAFGEEASASTGIPFASNQSIFWQNPQGCPKSFVSFFSVLGTTFSVIEVTDNRGVL